MSDPLKLMTIGRSASGRFVPRHIKGGNRYIPDLYEYAIKTYEVRLRVKDRVPIYKLVGEEDYKTCACLPQKYERRAAELAQERGLPLVSSVISGRIRQNRRAVLDPVSLMILYSKLEPKKRRGKRETSDVAQGLGEQGKGTEKRRQVALDDGAVARSVTS